MVPARTATEHQFEKYGNTPGPKIDLEVPQQREKCTLNVKVWELYTFKGWKQLDSLIQAEPKINTMCYLRKWY